MVVYAATEPKDWKNDRNFHVIGPWSHPGVGFDDGASVIDLPVVP